MKNQEMTTDLVPQASIQAVLSLIDSIAALRWLLAALDERGHEPRSAHAAALPLTETTHAVADEWVDRAHKLAEIVGWEGQRDLGEWIDDHPDRLTPRYLLPSGERTGSIKEALDAWYAVSPSEVREAAENAARLASEDAYLATQNAAKGQEKTPAEGEPPAGV